MYIIAIAFLTMNLPSNSLFCDTMKQTTELIAFQQTKSANAKVKGCGTIRFISFKVIFTEIVGHYDALKSSGNVVTHVVAKVILPNGRNQIVIFEFKKLGALL